MISILTILIFISCYLFYSISKKTIVSSNAILLNKLHNNEQLSKIIAISFLLIALVLASSYFGIFSGILFWLISLMLLMSLLVIMTPLNLINYKFLTVLFLALLLIEFIL